MTSKKQDPQDKARPGRYSFTQAMYNWKPPHKQEDSKFGLGLVLLFVLVLALVLYAIYRLS